MSGASPASSRDWSFGPIPGDWRALPLKYLCSRSSVYGANIAADVYENDGVRFLRTTDIRDDGALNEGGVFVPADIVADYMLSEGDFLISRSGTVGRAYVYRPDDGPCAYAGYLVRYALRDPETAQWLFYITKSPGFHQWLGAVAIEATIGNVNGEKYANLLIPVPPVNQQRAIADYLDRETARIDALIAAKERVLGLLAEKRRALITRAVTRGLDPRAPLRDSGIPWLGEIPSHWEIKKLAFLASLKSGEPITADDIRDDGPYAVYGGNGLRGYTDRFTHDGEYVLIGRQGALCGNINYSEGKFWPSEHAIVVTPRERVAVLWLGELLRVMNLNQYSASAAQPGLAVDTIAALRVPIPPFTEQRAIVEDIGRESGRLTEMHAATERTIALLKERRAALIAAAVTGQLEVA